MLKQEIEELEKGVLDLIAGNPFPKKKKKRKPEWLVINTQR
jgi:hypothetical protein